MFADKRLTVVGGSVRQRQLDGTRQAASKMVTARHNETAYFPNQMGNTPTSVMGFGSNQYIRTLSGIVPDQQEEALIDYYRDCYYYDNIGGATVDIVSVFPFSSWTLGGVSKEVAEVYGEALARLNMRLMMPEISRDHLVDGDFIGTLIYDQKAGTFSDILVHDRLACTVTPSPFRAVDASINVHSNVRLQQYVQAGNKFSDHILRNYPKRLLQAFLNGNVDLDPLTTLHIPRKALQDRGSASYLKRILPYYLLERTMYRGTLIEATKRQRATTHVQVGDDTWEPTSAELLAIRDMFQNTELDPLGAWVITRQGIQIQDVRPGGDFWKWTDVVDQVTPMKLRALGISEAFLSGDASYATAEAALSVFLENMEAYREFITYKVFDSKLFPLIAVLKGLYKDKSKVRNPDSVRDLIFNTNNQKNLEIPTIQWHKSLEAKEQDNQFEVLEKLSEKGYPIPMKMWAAAANIDIGSLLSDLKEDQEIKKAIEEITGVDPDQAAQQAEDQEGGGDFRMNAAARNPLAGLEVRSINDPRQSRRGPALLNREFDPGIKRMSRSGKVAHAVLNEREHVRKSNDLILKAAKALDDPNNREKVRRQIIARLGRMPNIIGVPK